MIDHEKSPSQGMISDIIIAPSQGIRNLSADYGKENRNKKVKKRKKMLIQQQPQMEMLLFSAMVIVLISHIKTLIG